MLRRGGLAVLLVVGLFVLYGDRAGVERRSPAAPESRRDTSPPEKPREEADAPAGAARGAPAAREPPDASPAEVRIEAPGGDLGPLRTLRGRVRWTDGAPVVGAEVVLHSSPLNAFPRIAVARARMEAKDRTDARGRFDLPWAPLASGKAELGPGRRAMRRSTGSPSSCARARRRACAMEEVAADDNGPFSIPGFTADDPAIVLWVRREGAKDDDAIGFDAVPRDGPVEIRLP